MLRSLFYEARIWPVVWRRRLHFYWHSGEKDNFAFLAMLGLPIVAIASIVYFAYSERARVELVSIDAVLQREVDLRCLAENVFFEARGEPLKGQYAVAEVTLNRLRSPYFPNTICEVVHETRWDRLRRRFVAHFSWTQLAVQSEPSGPAWQQAMAVATDVYDHANMPVVPDALFYHATSIRPSWARNKKPVAKIGNHIFYR